MGGGWVNGWAGGWEGAYVGGTGGAGTAGAQEGSREGLGGAKRGPNPLLTERWAGAGEECVCLCMWCWFRGRPSVLSFFAGADPGTAAFCRWHNPCANPCLLSLPSSFSPLHDPLRLPSSLPGSLWARSMRMSWRRYVRVCAWSSVCGGGAAGAAVGAAAGSYVSAWLRDAHVAPMCVWKQNQCASSLHVPCVCVRKYEKWKTQSVHATYACVCACVIHSQVRTAIVIKTQSALIGKYAEKSDEDMVRSGGGVGWL